MIYGTCGQVIRGTDPGIRIRTKMSRIPNTGLNFLSYSKAWIWICDFMDPHDKSELSGTGL